MLFIPLPFVVALLMIILAIQKIRSTDRLDFSGRLFTALMLAYGLQSIIIGLRWGYGMIALMPLQAVVATALAALAFVAFQSLTDNPARHSKAQLLHFLPALLVALFYITSHALIGPLIMLTFLAYGIALLWIARRGPDALVSARLDGVVLSYRALVITAITLILSSLTDLAISLDMTLLGGNHVTGIISGVNIVALVLLGTAAAFAGSSSSDTAAEETAEPASSDNEPTEQDHTIAAELDGLMRAKLLYKDTDLNLSRLARRLGRPARQVSQAINRIHRISVSQYVNNYRIEEACRLLQTSDDTITRLMFDAGFISKSNFNREFLRVSGKSPSRWRLEHGKNNS
jgi:AraC-like DNA-binding protein